MAKPDFMTLAERERSALLSLLTDLDDDQWAAPTLCPTWSVRDVAIHVVSYDELGRIGLAKAFLAGNPQVDSVNQRALDRYASLSTTEVVDLVARCQRPRGLTSGFGGRIALTDGTIHQQDIRRPLHLPRTIPDEQLRAVLDFALKAPTLPARRHARGLALRADDTDWSHGSGPEVTGAGEAILMAIAGRPEALADLEGHGVAILRGRLRPT